MATATGVLDPPAGPPARASARVGVWLPPLLLVVVSVLARLPALVNARGVNSDAAVVGLQAMHILHGEWSWFLWGAGYQASFDATQARYQSGLASLFELEDSRRTLFAAQTARVSLQRERAQAWVALYRSMGGGWTRAESTPMTSNPATKVATSP